MKTDQSLLDLREQVLAVEEQINSAVVGQQAVVRQCLICVLSRGHVLLEGDVGVGKTTLLRAIARALGGGYSRVEGTIDMSPSDLVYHTYIGEDGKPQVEPGPLLAHGENLSVFFFNEINRARPQVQAVMLRAMTENRIAAFNAERELPHLVAFADRNRVEKGETFELAAATRDRFMMELRVLVPTDAALKQKLILDSAFHDVDTLIARVEAGSVNYAQVTKLAPQIQQSVSTSDALGDYAVRLMDATHQPGAAGVRIDGIDADDLVDAGASPRGMSLMMRAARTRAFLEGRDYATPDDVRAVFHDSISHRVFFNPIYEFQRQGLAREFTQALVSVVHAP